MNEPMIEKLEALCEDLDRRLLGQAADDIRAILSESREEGKTQYNFDGLSAEKRRAIEAFESRGVSEQEEGKGLCVRCGKGENEEHADHDFLNEALEEAKQELKERIHDVFSAGPNEMFPPATAGTEYPVSRLQPVYYGDDETAPGTEGPGLREAAQEVWDSVPSTWGENDPLVKRHARALNALGASLKEGKKK